MKILLIDPARRGTDTFIFPPISIMNISMAARAAGHEAEIIDVPYLLEKFPEKYNIMDGSIFDYILSKECDILGLSGHVTTYFFYDAFIRKYRAAKKDIPIVVGHSVGEPNKKVWEKHNPVDYLVEGHGEVVIRKLLDGLEKKDYESIQKIPGLLYLKDGQYQRNPIEPIGDIDKLPYLDYDDVDAEYYIEGLSKWLIDVIPGNHGWVKPLTWKDVALPGSLLHKEKPRFLPMLSTRGCPYECTFCFHAQTKMYYHSADYVIGNIKYLREKYRINGIVLQDDMFVVDPKRTERLCDRLYEEDLGISLFVSGGKPNLVTDKVLASMRRAGVLRFSYGIETGSQDMLDSMQKKATTDQNRTVLENTEKNGIASWANICFGMDGENHETLSATRDFMISNELTTKRFYGSWATAYPGSHLYDDILKKGLIKDVREYLFRIGSTDRMVLNFSDLPDNILQQKVFELHRQVDMAYLLKIKQYKKYFFKLLEILIGKIFFLLDEKKRDHIKLFKNKLLTRKSARVVKHSQEDVEKFAANQLALIQNNRI
jgi:anaerobic magnesium-protoporphyrin IX monomethyl ester cyclase